MVELMSNYVSSPSWMGILTLIAIITMLIGIPMNLKNKNFEVKRVGNELKVTSNTPWLQSKEFTIHSENDEYIYIKDKELYEIKKSELK